MRALLCGEVVRVSVDVGDYTAAVSAHLERVRLRNADAVHAVSELFLDCVREDGVVITAGAGHSLAAVAETFYRAGGLACVYPLYHPELLPLHGARASSVAERRSGLAEEVAAPVGLARPNVLVVFSTSGVNPYPVELAARARDAACPVVAVTSPAASAAAPRRSDGRLADYASVVVDTLVPAGDAGYPLAAPLTAPLSTVTNAFVWNLLLVTVLDMAASAGVRLPLWRSANTVGGDAANAELFERYGRRVPMLA